MSWFLRAMRRLLHGSDARRAVEDEARVLKREDDKRQALTNEAEAAYSSKEPSAVTVGLAVPGDRPIRVPRSRLAGHMGLWGPSGAGKSYLLALILSSLLRSGTRRLVVADPKEETVDLAKRAIIDVARALPPREAEELLGRVVILDLFSNDNLPKLQVLAPEPGLDPELHAYEIANLITAEMDMAAGVRQEAILHRVVECLIRARLPITVLPTALLEPALIARLAETCSPPDLFVTTATRLAKESKERILGLVARVERLLRLRSTRLVLGGARTCIDFAELLGERIALINLAPPQGSGDIGRFLSGLVWLKLAHAIRRRPNGAPRVHVAIDEWPTFLAAGGARLADSFEELLRLARSKGVFLTVLSQDMTSVAKVSSTLPEIVKTNLHLHAIFRASDAHAWDFALPVTGRRRRPRTAPWEERRAEYLDRSAELALLREELSRLPDRECYLVDRRTGLPGVRMRTADLSLDASPEDVRGLVERASRSDLVAPVAELEEGERAVRERVEQLLGRASPPDPAPPSALQRRKRPREIG